MHVRSIRLAAGAAAACVVLAFGGPAEAGGGGPKIAVEQTHPAGSGVHYILELTDADDQGVGGATVTATPSSPDGTEGAPVTMVAADDQGHYEGAVELPEDGTWTISFTSTNPDASLDYSQDIPAEPLTADTSSDDPSPVLPLAIAGVFVAALAALGIWALMERRRPSTPQEEPQEQPQEDPA